MKTSDKTDKNWHYRKFGSSNAPTVSVLFQAGDCSHMGMQRGHLGSGDKVPSQIVAISWLTALPYWELHPTPPPIQPLEWSLPPEALCPFQHNLLAVTLSQSWRWSLWAVAWKLHPHRRSAVNLVPNAVFSSVYSFTKHNGSMYFWAICVKLHSGTRLPLFVWSGSSKTNSEKLTQPQLVI